jgi:glycosyltransferase involved in cell wall biosynthesis
MSEQAHISIRRHTGCTGAKELNKSTFEVSVVVPVFRSESSLTVLFSRLISTFSEPPIGFELIFVEDCGGDRSWEIIQSLVKSDQRVRGYRLSRNYGQHNALLCGIREARGDVIVTLDDDLQNPPEEIPRMLAKLAEGYDVVYGTPIKEAHGFFREIASQITKLVLKSTMGAITAAKVSAFRIFRTDLRNAFEHYRSPMVNIDVLLTWGTARFAAIEVRQEKRFAGESGYTLLKLIHHAFNMMTGFSTIPLQISSVLGFIFGLFGICVLLYVFLRYFIEGSSVPGFPFLAAIISIFSGVQLFSLGIIGEYLARIHFRTMNRPPFMVSEAASAASKTKQSETGTCKYEDLPYTGEER